MPTNYTYPVYENENYSFKEFAINCAKAFGACFNLRDSLDQKVPDEFKPDSYHKNKIIEIEKKIKQLERFTKKEREDFINSKYEEELKSFNESKEESIKGVENLNKMLKQVEAWTPPSDEHIEYKNFMISQLQESIDWEDIDNIDKYKPNKKDFKFIDYISLLKTDIEYHEKQYDKEINKCKSNTEWVNAIRESFNG